MAATYSSPALSLFDQLLLPISTRVVHPTLLPISLLTLIHATRVSHGATQVQGGVGRLPLLQSVVLVWILLFGGFTLLRVALAQPIPLFDPGVQWTAFVYGGVHAASQLSGVSHKLSNIAASAERGIYLDLFFSLVDSICRMEGIAKLGIEPVRHHASWITPLLTSVIIGGGGPLLIGLLNLGSPQWRLQAPTWLTDPAGLMAVDIWSSAVVGGTYWLLSHPRGQGVAMLDARQAQLAGSVLLFSLLAGTRFRRHFQSSAKATSKEVEKPRNGDAIKQRSRISSRQLIYFAMALPTVLLGLQAILAGDNFGSNGRDIIADPSSTVFAFTLKCFTDLRLQAPSQVLFLLAHPDDEVMFFSPILHSLVSSPTTQVWAACLSIGQSSPSPLIQADSSALPLRIQELVSAYSHFSVDESRIIWVNDLALQDGMQQVWDPQRVVDVVINKFASVNTTASFNPDWIITFDEYGISGHANHKALAQAAPLLARELGATDRAPATVYRLATLPLPFKYAGLPYALWQRLVSLLSPASPSSRTCLTALSTPEQYLTSLQAMRSGHRSQMKWFRWLWWMASSYVYGAEVCPDD